MVRIAVKKNPLHFCAAGLCFVLLAICGGSSPSAPSAAPNSSASPATVAQLQEIVLQAGDLTGGWKDTPAEGDRSDTADTAETAECVGAGNTDAKKVSEARSSKFSLARSSVQSRAASYRSKSDTDANIAMVLSSKFASGVEQQLRKSLESGGEKIDTVSFTLTPGADGGPANVFATGNIIIKLNQDGRPVSLYQRLVYISGPLVMAFVEGTNSGLPITAPQMESMVAAVATRAARG